MDGSQVSTHHSRNRIQGEEVREQEQQGVPIQVRRPEEKKESEGNVISQDTRQINLKVVESGKGLWPPSLVERKPQSNSPLVKRSDD